MKNSGNSSNKLVYVEKFNINKLELIISLVIY